jgi:hypothetical protein
MVTTTIEREDWRPRSKVLVDTGLSAMLEQVEGDHLGARRGGRRQA